MEQSFYILLEPAAVIEITKHIVHVLCNNSAIIFDSQRIEIGYSDGFFTQRITLSIDWDANDDFMIIYSRVLFNI